LYPRKARWLKNIPEINVNDQRQYLKCVVEPTTGVTTERK